MNEWTTERFLGTLRNTSSERKNVSDSATTILYNLLSSDPALYKKLEKQLEKEWSSYPATKRR